MRQITKDIEITVDGTRQGFRLFKPDAFSGVMLLRRENEARAADAVRA
jgi:hypothetical protein